MTWSFKTKRPTHRFVSRRQRGFSLISMMVGVVVTSISVLAMMALYKSAVFHIYNPQTGSETFSIRNQQNMTGLLTMQLLMQKAGFGIPAATTNSHIILVNGAGLSSTTGQSQLSSTGNLVAIGLTAATGNALFWEENTALSDVSANYTCRGLVSDPNDFAVYQLASTASCHPIATQWAGQTWQITRVIKPNVLSGQIQFNAALNISKCSPFGSEIDSALLSSVGSLAGVNSDAATKAGLQVDVNWSQSASYTPWRSCLVNFSQ
ncbi:prepilin-type N-terminal cleavage/methylation domain-containing protein [Shewanella avicenniae]|uniref:Prepilin-type N-terminal cleavage/methylation domain-containing protein n=1 Tax=Shewanella avicenniae TaxID=2814294 RepID=A0ABX7QN96_9GAMM|nr:prepilin-type N-terminal cleavage/methylation domain-containing protein [Shewanella avicenniae]QSX32183.1 prepilin-type N-terminal cleavage/methylation domain-containing protein [Shewanella avicenniae]